MPRMKRNFVVKTIDGRTGPVQRALKAAGIEVVSVLEIFKEEIPEDASPDTATPGAAAPGDAPAPVAVPPPESRPPAAEA